MSKGKDNESHLTTYVKATQKVSNPPGSVHNKEKAFQSVASNVLESKNDGQSDGQGDDPNDHNGQNDGLVVSRCLLL